MESKLNHDMRCTHYIHVQCPIYDPLRSPVQYYTVTVNNNDTATAVDDGSCSYSVTIAVSPQDAPYSVSVVATNDVGDSDAVLVDNISKWNILHFEYIIDTCYILVSVQDIVTVTSTVNSINFTFDTTIDGTTPVTVTLSPNVMEEGSIGGGVVISGLMPDTLYTYTVSFVYNNISYSTQSSVTTLTAPTTTTSSSGMDKWQGQV